MIFVRMMNRKVNYSTVGCLVALYSVIRMFYYFNLKREMRFNLYCQDHMQGLECGFVIFDLVFVIVGLMMSLLLTSASLTVGERW